MVDIKEGFQITSELSSVEFQKSRRERKREREKKAPPPSSNVQAVAPSARLKNWSLEGRESWNQFGLLIPHEALIPALTFSNELKRL